MEKKLTLATILEGMDDFRQENSIDHLLVEILIITIIAVICGANGYHQISLYAKANENWLRGFLELKNGLPSEWTIRRVLMNIDPKQFHDAFIEWVQLICDRVSGVVAVDGKTARRTKCAGKKALHVVSAFATANKLVLGQIATEEKSNEITAIPELLKMLVIEGCVITIDAMGTQKDIAKLIVNKKADYLLSLKGNQETLFEDIKLYMETEVLSKSKSVLAAAGLYHRTVDNAHGRFEVREYYICNDVDWLSQKDDWVKLRGFGLCVSTVEIDGKTTVSYNYYIYSVENMTAERFAAFKRAHWAIENTLHWTLDMAFREDESRASADNSAENLNIIRHISANLLRQDKSARGGIATKRLLCGWDRGYLARILAGAFLVGS